MKALKRSAFAICELKQRKKLKRNNKKQSEVKDYVKTDYSRFLRGG